MLKKHIIFTVIIAHASTKIGAVDLKAEEIALSSEMFLTGKIRPQVTKESLDLVQNFAGDIPESYRNLLLQYGSKILKRVDLSSPHDGASSSLVTYVHNAKAAGLNTEAYFPFSKSDEFYYCIERASGVVKKWNSFKNKFTAESWTNLHSWLAAKLGLPIAF